MWCVGGSRALRAEASGPDGADARRQSPPGVFEPSVRRSGAAASLTAELSCCGATSAATDDVVLSLVSSFVLSPTTKTNVLSLTHQPWR